MSFKGDLLAFAEKSKENMAEVTRKVVQEVGAKIVERSPVGDGSLWKSPPPPGYAGGRFRGNWQYGFNASPTGDLPDIDPTGEVSIQRIGAVLGEPGLHYIVNGLPYAQRLENGWSTQAPAGMVGLVKIEFSGIVDLAAQGVKK